MAKSTVNIWRKGRKCSFELYVHLIFLTKHKDVFKIEHFSRLKEIFEKTARQMKCQLIDFQADKDYVHLFVAIYPTISVSSLTAKLKGKSSYFLTREFADIKDKTLNKVFWSSSYCAISHGEDTSEQIKRFLEQNKN